MADTEVRSSRGAERPKNRRPTADQEQQQSLTVLQRFLRSREGILIVWALIAFLALNSVLLWHAFKYPILTSNAAKAWFISASTILWLPLVLLLLDPPDNYAKGPRLRLPLTCMGILSGLTAFAVAESMTGGHLLNPAHQQDAAPAQFAFFSFFVLAFLPVAWNAINFSRYAEQRRAALVASGPPLDDDGEREDAEAVSALIATLLVIGVAILAYFAGEHGAGVNIEHTYGIVLGGLVIGAFGLVVFLGTIEEFAPVRHVGHWLRVVSTRVHPLAAAYNAVDSALVRVGAHVVGMSHMSVAGRYAVLLGTLSCLSLLGWYLPPPLGLAPCVVGLILAISISRLWGWVEEDRALAAMTDYRRSAPYRVGFREDFRDESLIAFIFVFLIVPTAMMQLDDGQFFGDHLFKNGDAKPFSDWFGFFGVELAKSIPIIDWAEVYGVHTTDDMISVNGVASMHVVFLARLLIDLLLIASLVQALGITTRNRQQKQLYKARHVDRLDPFVERSELSRAVRAAFDVDTGQFKLMRLRQDDLVDFRRYDEERLRQIYASSDDLPTRHFIEAIAHAGSIPLDSAINLTIEIAESHKNEVEMVQAFQRARAEHESGMQIISAGDLYRILAALRSSTGLKDFKRAVMETMFLLNEDGLAIDFLLGLAAGAKADSFLYARDCAAEIIGRLSLRLGERDKLQAVHTAVQHFLIEAVAPRPAATRAAIAVIESRMRQFAPL